MTAVIIALVLAADLAAIVGLYALGGWPLIAGVVAAGAVLVSLVGWWLHTWSEREARR